MGLNINQRDKKGTTQLHLSVRTGDREKVRHLLEVGCDVNAKNNKHETALLRANFEDPRMVELLLNAEADSSVMNRKYRTPLHLAVLARSLESVKLLLNAEGSHEEICVRMPDKFGKGPMDYAINAGLVDIQKIILQGIANRDFSYFDEYVCIPT